MLAQPSVFLFSQSDEVDEDAFKKAAGFGVQVTEEEVHATAEAVRMATAFNVKVEGEREMEEDWGRDRAIKRGTGR